MKTKTISMMLIGMMMLGTTTGFGKTTIVKKQSTHVTVVKKQTPDKNCHCKRFVEDPLTKGSNCEDIRKKQQKKTINYCDSKNCTKQKKDNNKCKVTKKGQKCTCKTCKPQPVKSQNHSGGKPMKK